MRDSIDERGQVLVIVTKFLKTLRKIRVLCYTSWVMGGAMAPASPPSSATGPTHKFFFLFENKIQACVSIDAHNDQSCSKHSTHNVLFFIHSLQVIGT